VAKKEKKFVSWTVFSSGSLKNILVGVEKI